jgi:hypothetical protein
MSLASLPRNKAARRALGTSRRALLLVVLSCGALLGVGAVPASAAVTHEFEFSFNGSDVTDTPTGPFSAPGANAFDRTGAAVYVLDSGRSVVDKFNADGTYAGVQITGASTPAGSFSVSYTAGVAVDNSGLGTDASNGDVYVANTNDNVVDKFTASGTFVCQITGEGSASTDPTHECSTSQAGVGSITPTGLAVDSSGNLFVADSAHDVVDEFDSAGNYTGHQIADSHITKPATIALDSSGNLYVTNLFSNVVEFDATGAFVRTVDSHSSLSVGVDPATAHVYVAEYSQTPIAEYDPSGNLVDTFGSGRLGLVLGLAVRGSSGEVYADDFSNGVVDVFGPDAVIPDLTTTAATEVKQFTATLNGTVDPAGGGQVESCEFEYGTTSSYGQTAPCSPATPYASATNVNARVSALQPDTTYHFRVKASNSNGIVSYSSDQTLSTLAVAVTGQATNVTGTSATLGGTVDPDGTTITDCHFEYGKTASYGHSQPCASTPSGSSPVAVSADVAGLAENTTYHFRLVAAYSGAPAGSPGSDAGSDETFATLSRPHIDAAYTSNLNSSSVDLNAEINPKGFDSTYHSTYHFEWGTSTGYGNSVPVPDADIGSGTSDVPVTQHLEGLSANTVYHWRVVATNSVGTIFGQDHTFVYQTTTPFGVGCANEQLRAENALSLSLPDCRAYEQVSPVDKNGNDVANAFAGNVNQQAAVDGDRVFYEAVGAFPGAPAAVAQMQYLASRGASGWSTRAVGHPLTSTHVPGGGGVDYSLSLSPDLSTGVFRAEPALVAGAPGPGIWNLYVGHLLTGSNELVTDVNPPNQSGSNFNVFFHGASTDFSHVIFSANDALTPEAPWPNSFEGYNLYEWVEGQLHLVGLIPTSGTSCTGAECTPADGEEAGGRNPVSFLFAHAISADGSRIVFSTGAQEFEKHIYDRLNGTTTVDVSASQRTPPEPGTTSAHYQDASVDGSHVLFTSAGALTNDAVPGSGQNLYDYDVETGQLTDLTAANDARVQGLAGLSEDASHVYFVAEGVLAANSNSHGDTAVAGQPNLYLWNGGQTTFIATTFITTERQEQPTRVTPDGAHLAFNSTARLTGYDNTDANTGEPDIETYLYDAAANRLICASCNPSGARPIGPSDLHWLGSVLYAPRNLTADGSRLFFTSRDALLPGDTNGLYDVYEWEADGSGSCQSSTDNGGCLYLISGGSGATNSYFADASPSGNDVFFQTGDSLVGQDQDNYADLYDARVGGGFASQDKRVVPPACTSLEGCRSPLSEPPAQLSVASAELHGPGNLVTPPEVPTTAVKKTAAQIRAEKLTKALKACKKKPKKKRAKCQKQANKSFGKAK